ncbi:MAG: hypothetical protein IKG21_13170 [Atopobiaceae bacterium]|nr:hypothetical protein [Atopobiaceae bacterium]
MAEDTAQGQATTTPDGEGTTQTAPAGQSGSERTYTQAEVDALMGGYVPQDEVNRLVGKARREARSKYDGYDEYKAHAEAWADYDEVAAARDKATAEVESLKAQIAHRDLVDKVADATGVPRSLLKGETEDELNASAEAIKAYAGTHAAPQQPQPTYPQDKGGGTSPSPITKEQIESIKDPVERVKLRAQHMDLY